MAKANNGQPAVRHQPPPPELIDKFLSLQQQELQLRTEELAISAQREANERTIAEISISANLQDRQNERAHREKRTKLIFIGSTVIIVVVLLFMGFALYSGKDAIITKALEIISIFSAGFIGGYGLKSSKQPAKEPSDG